MRFAVAAALLPPAAGHGHMTWPPPRDGSSPATAGTCQLPNAPDDLTPEDGQCRWFNQGCQAGMANCTDTFEPNPCKTQGNCMEPTVTDPKARSWKIPNCPECIDWTKYNPWRSPGHAPVFSPCGLAGGGATYHPQNGGLPPHGVAQGADGRDLPQLTEAKTFWPQGSVQEVSWSIHANHGGGYAYRLCPMSKEGGGKKSSMEMSEECFQAHHLQFASDQSWIQYGGNLSNRTAITATRISEGTHPKGSQWTRSPVPACGDPSGGEGCGETWGEPTPGCNATGPHESRPFQCTLPPMFEPPLPGLYGYGGSSCFDGAGDGAHTQCTKDQLKWTIDHFKFNVIDMVVVPKDLPPGDYLLSFRWDCEQTPQIWAQCADVTITTK